MTNSFDISIPMKDHPMVITLTPHQSADQGNKFDVYYQNGLCGFFLCNEHNVWIYEPHANASLLLNEEQIKHLGAEIGRRA